MCGSVILIGGLFLFIMNIYNYHMRKKEETAEDIEQNQKNMEKQDQVEMKQTTEAVTEKTEPEAKEEIETERGSCPEETETPK